MSMLKIIFRTESMLLFRNKLLAIPLIMNLFFWGYTIVAYEIQATHIQERAAVFYSGFIWVLLFNLLMTGLFAVYMMSKDRESTFESLVVTYPVKNTEWMTGKWLVTQVYGLCITLITLIVQIGWFASSKMALADIVKNGIYLFVQMEGAFFIMISLGFLCGVFVRNIFAYILVPVILVLSIGLPFDYSGQAYTYDNPRLHLLAPFDYMFIESPYEGIWGIHRVFDNALVHQSAVLLLGLVVFFIALFCFYTNRRIEKEKKLIPVLIVVFIIPTLLLGGMRYTQYNQALGQYVTTGEMYIKAFEEEQDDYYDSSLDHTTNNFSMERMDLAVQLQSNHQIAVTSNMTITHHGSEAVHQVQLTLYHGLEVTECSSEFEITCTRDKDLLTIELADEIGQDDQLDLTLKYQGDILQYRDEGNVEHAFIDDNRVYLPKEAGWYPLIGERQLIIAREHDKHYVKFEQRNGGLFEDYPTEYTVNVLNEAGEIPLALTIPETETGMYQGNSQYGLSVVGGTIEEIKVGEVRVVGHPEVIKGAADKVKQYQEGWDFIEDWLGESVTPSVIYILNNKYAYLTDNTLNQEFQVWDKEKLAHMNHVEVFAHELWNYLVKDISIESTATDELEYMSYHYLSEATTWVILNQLDDVDNFKDWYLDGWRELNEDEEKLFTELNRYAEKGNEEFKDVVKYLLTYVEQLEDSHEFDLAAALELYERNLGL